MSTINLCHHRETIQGVHYIIDLQGKLTNTKFWKFTIQIIYSVEGVEMTSKIPFKLFNEIRKKLITDTEIKVSNKDISYVLTKSGTLDIKYHNAHFSWPKDLVTIIRESSFTDKFAKALRKCNFPFEGLHEDNILSWKDNQGITTDVDAETFIFTVANHHLKNTDTYDLWIEATTSPNLNRWFAKVLISLSAKHSSRYSGAMFLDVIDFLALRDFFIEYKKDESKIEISLPSAKTTKIKKDDAGNLIFDIDGQQMFFYPEFISYLAQGSFIPNMAETLTKLNYEMTPQPITRWWFKSGAMIMDVGVDNNPN